LKVRNKTLSFHNKRKTSKYQFVLKKRIKAQNHFPTQVPTLKIKPKMIKHHQLSNQTKTQEKRSKTTFLVKDQYLENDLISAFVFLS